MTEEKATTVNKTGKVSMPAFKMTNSQPKRAQEADEQEETTSTTEPNGADKFVFVEDFKKGLDLAFLTGENIIFHGKGGHGKSEYVEHYFEAKGITPFVKTMGSGTNTDSLFGGVDIKEFNDSGKLQYLVENSFMAHEYVVFEELFDAPDYILEQLKDILTSKKFRQGTHVYNIKTKLIVCCTNKTRDEFSKNDSLKALMERFPLEYKVQWNSYTRSTYEFMFRSLFEKPFSELSYILEKLAEAGTIVSPRTAVKAAKILTACKGDMKCLDFIADFGGKNRDLVLKEVKKFKDVMIIEGLLADIDVAIESCSALPITSLDDVKKVKNLVKEIDANVKALETKKADDALTKIITGKVKGYQSFIQTKTKQITDVLEA